MCNNQQQLSILDILNILSFVIGLMNLGENLNQGDKQDLLSEFNNKASLLLDKINEHLEKQDKQLTEILEHLKG